MTNKPASASDELPPHELPEPDPDARPDGNNATTHRPDPKADQHRARQTDKERGPYTTGNY
jgi:hypothetical protein